MKCNECDGSGYNVIEDMVHEVLVKERCVSCLQAEQQVADMMEDMKLLLASSSPQLLAYHLSKLIGSIALERGESDTLMQQIQSKNRMGVLSWTSLF